MSLHVEILLCSGGSVTADQEMNQTGVLHIVERVEAVLAKLPGKIRRPVLKELTPLKELFLQQRPPRYLFTGSSTMPLAQIIDALFPAEADQRIHAVVMPVHEWTEWNVFGRGTISVLDARDAPEPVKIQIDEQLRRQPADIIFLLDDGESRFANVPGSSEAKIIRLSLASRRRSAELVESPETHEGMRSRLLGVFRMDGSSSDMRRLVSVLTEALPNEAKIEMIRISRNRDAQHHVAHMLVKSTTAICTAVGAQPIPLADLPILTSLQLMMISGIMYVSGRERSMRAATEFVTALGANVGAALVLREGARAALKFFPGWGNIVCGLIAGSGTYAIGRAAAAFFIDGISLNDARRTYLRGRKQGHLVTNAARAGS